MSEEMKSFIRGMIFVVCLSGAFARADVIGTNNQLEYPPPAADNGEILVDFSNNDSPSTVTSILQAAGVTESQYSWFSREERWVSVRNATAALLSKLRGSPDVDEVEPNYYLSAFSGPNDPYYKYQWHLDQIGMQRACRARAKNFSSPDGSFSPVVAKD